MRIGSMTTLKRDRLCVLSGFGIVVLVAWLYLVVNPQRADMTGGADGMGMGQGMRAMTEVHPWSTATFALTLAMWAAMMIAMMVPSAAPMALMYAAVARKAAAQQSPVAPTFVFVAGYVAVWAVFSVAATTSQWILDRMALLSPLMVSRSSVLGSGLLIAAGVYQLTPLKRVCRVLLGVDGAVVRRWRNEPAVDRGHRGVRSVGEDAAVRRDRRTHRRRSDGDPRRCGASPRADLITDRR
jgi:predicted metal-binding membrane protein